MPALELTNASTREMTYVTKKELTDERTLGGVSVKPQDISLEALVGIVTLASCNTDD